MDEKEKIIEIKLKTVDERLQILEEKIDSLTIKVDKINELIESGEINVPVRMNNYINPWKVKDIIQYLVDRPADTLMRVSDTSKKVKNIIDLLKTIGWIFMIIALAILIATR